MNIKWSPLAIDRIIEVSQLIAADKPKAAENWVTAIFEAVDKLAHYPKAGRVVPEIDKEEIRELIYKGYRIIYKSRSERIEILTVRHGNHPWHFLFCH